MSSLFILAGVLLLAGAGLLLFAARENETSDPASVAEAGSDEERQDAERPVRERTWRETSLETRQKLGLSTSVGFIVLYLTLQVVLVLGAQQVAGISGLGASLVIAVAGLLLLGQLRKSRMRRKIIRQLPGFIEQLNRRVKVGLSLNQALIRTVPTIEAPLQSVVERVIRRAELGAELYVSFSKESQLTGVREFQLLGVVFKVNHQFGGSVSQALENLVELLQQDERSQRELKSLTGETRVTAWVMGLTPSVMAGFMLINEPQSLQAMWMDEQGKLALQIALGSQLFGVVLLWRMLRAL
ncbi:type II secretion system F family protein [Photobacterium atrarenae]|uniref:Type II secretion system F family protein n=1 Tax=Photobacterium atrarenae TaxID=865757 RepID=A0ABY5GHJ7_9GAMM|nr:type II secretion system F family protein [Photobacterium atrarenae]UTV28605.1 type II secretion system F family protein [Photobacterium atrarenae]